MLTCEEIASEFKDYLLSKIFGDDNIPTYTQIIFASSIGLIIAAAMHIRFRKTIDYNKIIPWIRVSKTRQPLKLERFHDYVGINTIQH